ncbi:hypothetical protein ACOME3_002032 [Neoechinorhynchus agilis]
MSSMTSLIDYFTNNADYTCWIPDNVSMSDAIPINADGKFEKCKVFENYTSLSNKIIPCPNGYIHPLPDDRSLVFTFDLYCDREYLKDIPQSAFFVGAAIGSAVLSMFGDNFAQYRGIQCIMANFIWGIGMLMLDLVAYFVRGWRNLYLTVYVPVAITVLYYWIMRESLFWLAVHKRQADVNKILTEAYKMNSTKQQDQMFLSLDDDIGLIADDSEAPTSVPLPNRIKKNLKAMFSSIVFPYSLFCGCLLISLASFGYFGLTLSASAFSSNVYLHFFITTIIEIPQFVSSSVATKFFGRKTLSLFSNLLLVLISIIFAILPSSNKEALNVFNHIAKLSAAANADIVWIFATELFPTRYRQFGLGIAVSWSRIITAFSPFLKDLLTSQRLVAMLSIGGFALLVAILLIFLPETKYHTMAELSDMKGLRQCARETFSWMPRKPKDEQVSELQDITNGD